MSRTAWLIGSVALATCAIVAISVGNGSHRAAANHAFLHSDGIGFDGIGPDFGWTNVFVTSSAYSESIGAIDAWRRWSHGSIFWLRHTANTGEAQAEIIDRNTSTLFGPVHLYICNTRFNDNPQTGIREDLLYATTIVTDAAGDLRLNDGAGYWAKRPGVPFLRASACLNNQNGIANDAGTIAHELGHILGLNHVVGNSPPSVCPDTGLNSVMTYNYSNWLSRWPADTKPTIEDVYGPWICNTLNGGGLAYVYGPLPGDVGGFGLPTPTNTPTRTPTKTFTPTKPHTPTPTPTPTPVPPDADGDGVGDPIDNCPLVYNPLQENTDGAWSNGPSIPGDDLTVPLSDTAGNACDTDADNDARPDSEEVAGTGCASASGDRTTNVSTDNRYGVDGVGTPAGTAIQSPPPSGTSWDTDGDMVPDGVECNLGTDPGCTTLQIASPATARRQVATTTAMACRTTGKPASGAAIPPSRTATAMRLATAAR